MAVIAVLLSFLLMHLSSPERGEISIAENLIRDIFTPLQRGVNELRHDWGGIASILNNKEVLSQQIQALQKENQELKIENQVLRESQEELKRLRSLLDFQSDSLDSYALLPARVISRSPNNWYRYLLINKGSKQGIKKGMPVISPDGLVGQVGSVSKESAQVNLITDREVAVGAILQESRETNGIIEGRGDNNLLRMINIPYYSPVEKNNRVISSGLSVIYPRGIDIGVVKNISREPGGLLLSADIEPVVNFDKLEEVLIITSFKPAEAVQGAEGSEN
ncbi:MAG: rod shape-determining protein MreC [Syntrophomonas sp.]|nr:rod shape-determining protein MreC [Syntrophomonas sp.]